VSIGLQAMRTVYAPRCNLDFLTGGILTKVGLDRSKIGALGSRMRKVNVRGGIDKARTAARNNPSLVLGGLAALAIGAGLMRRRAMMR
jgi:hypothetical protein